MPSKQVLFLAACVCVCVCVSAQKLNNYISKIDITSRMNVWNGEAIKLW